MAKQRIICYLTEEQYSTFQQYKADSGIGTDGEAGAQLILSALGLIERSPDEPAFDPQPEPDRVDRLEQQITAITATVEDLRSQLRSLATPPSQQEKLTAIAQEYGLKRASEITPVEDPGSEAQALVETFAGDVVEDLNPEPENFRSIENLTEPNLDNLPLGFDDSPQPGIDFPWAEVEPGFLQEWRPEFWEWMVARAIARNERAAQTGNKQIDPNYLALKKCREEGGKFYQEWATSLDSPSEPRQATKASQVSNHKLVWSIDYMTWRQAAAQADNVIDYIAQVQTTMAGLGFNWTSPEVAAWIARAREVDPFYWDPKLGQKALPDWALLKLAFDLGNAINGGAKHAA